MRGRQCIAAFHVTHTVLLLLLLLPALFPYFLRAAPPDRLQATAAAMLVGRLLKDFATHSLVDGANPQLGWITAENDLYVVAGATEWAPHGLFAGLTTAPWSTPQVL